MPWPDVYKRQIYQCGLPKEMAVELFRPFIMKKLVQDGSANNIKSAKKMVDKGHPAVWDALDLSLIHISLHHLQRHL